MSFDAQVQSLCLEIQRNYYACDVVDALLKLKVPSSGFLSDITSIRGHGHAKARIVAPISTVLFVPKSGDSTSSFGADKTGTSNIPEGHNWTDRPAPGTIVLAQQPKGQSCALIGDIMVTRLKIRGVVGAIIDGRIRDVESCAALCEGGDFHLCSTGVSAVGPSLVARAWAVDVPLQFGNFCIRPGDILCADEADRSALVIPREYLQQVLAMLPILKEASSYVLNDVRNGLSLPEAIRRHPNFYSNYKED